MKGYCDVCKKITNFYNAFGNDNLAVCCRECRSLTDRKDLKNNPNQTKLIF